jgi:hypothetical protein
MPQWVFYVLVVTGLMSVSGWLIEQALQRRQLQTRFAWVAAMGVTVLLAYISFPLPIAPDVSQPLPSRQAWTVIQHVAPVSLPPVLSKPTTSATYTNAMRWDTAIVGLWRLLSTLVTLALVCSGAYTFWRRRKWPMRLLGSHCVCVAPDIGPAVVGLLRPTIVIPQWVIGAEPSRQQLILAHEASHLQARDPLLLTTALVTLILMPWNFLLWWQLHRLRHAIEVDCDTRVLRGGLDMQAYGEALIEVGQRRSGFIGAVAAMSESRTLLEKRIEIMTLRTRKPSTYGFAILCALAITVTTAATQVTGPESPTAHQEISVDTVTLDRYVGKYQIQSTAILTITREGSQLNAQITGQPKLPIYAETPTKFVWKVVDAQVTFAADGSGLATSATIHQNGRDIVAARMDEASAQGLEQQLAQRISSQQPQSGSEAALRKHIAAIQAGAPDYDDMTPLLQGALRKQISLSQPVLKGLGPVQSIEFKGVSDNGADKYLVSHQSGKQSQWIIALDTQGKTSGLLMLPVF